MKRNEVKDWMVENLGIEEPSNAQVSSMMSYLNDLKRNTIVETTEKISHDYEGWLSPQEAEELRGQIDSYETEKAQFGDYDELKQFKADFLKREEDSRRHEFLKGHKVKEQYFDMVMGQLDWDKAKYDDKKKTYTGLDDQIKASKEKYSDLFEADGKPGSLSFEGGASNGGKAQTNPNQAMNNFIRGL